MQDILFYLFAILLLGGIGGVFMGEDRIKNVLWLIFSFFQAAVLMILLGAEFIAMLFLIIYVGAVAVLFLFMVMMHDGVGLRQPFSLQGLSLSLGGILLCEMSVFLTARESGYSLSSVGKEGGSAQAIGRLMYGNGGEMVLISGLILLLAMIGSIVLILRHKKRKKQNVKEQIEIQPRNTVRFTRPQIGKGISDYSEENHP